MSEKHEKEEIAFGPEIAPGIHTAIRRRGNEVKQVLIRRSKEGEPILPGTELVVVGESTCECSGGHWRELKTLYKNQRPTEDGPAQVATPEYRKGYDRIFGKKQKVGLA